MAVMLAAEEEVGDTVLVLKIAIDPVFPVLIFNTMYTDYSVGAGGYQGGDSGRGGGRGGGGRDGDWLCPNPRKIYLFSAFDFLSRRQGTCTVCLKQLNFGLLIFQCHY
ncbi:uncharacterized protein LOC108483077 isoform X3 [Gossypium arboreum]|uniref:Uncharacterized protein n=1 Tax=Gossypium arboreum TaxID=29729 RepID=A0ABR0PVE1_GOSAR|nr:uncharacterized protein LOC108483077 isoform X3 [Gossypium arboreum]KAK5830778.1 hypothetical protein PVK06_014573 [Gossypium arboreum]